MANKPVHEISGVQYYADYYSVPFPLNDNTYVLYCQDDIRKAPANTTYYLSNCIYFQGGEYTVRVIVDDNSELYIDNKLVLSSVITTSTYNEAKIVLSRGNHLVYITYTNVPVDTPSYVAFEFYNGTNTTPEYASRAEGWYGDDYYFNEISGCTTPDPLDYPVWLPRPTWNDGIKENLDWLTNILTSESGAEQRRKLRRFPRRSMSANFAEWDTFNQNVYTSILALGKFKCNIPIFWDKQRTSVALAKGDTVIYGDFANRPEYIVGGVGILRTDDLMTYDQFVIMSIADDGTSITIRDGLYYDWPVGSELYPVAVGGNISAAADATFPFSRGGTYSVQFNLGTVEAYSADWGDLPVYADTKLSVLNIPGNWREDRQFTIDRNVYSHDNKSGVNLLTDVGQNSTITSALSIMLQGRDEHVKFYKLMFAMAGQLKTFHAPTWMQDLTLAKDIIYDDNALVVEQMGYSMLNAVSQNVLQWVMVELKDGTQYFDRVISNRTVDGQDWLMLQESLTSVDRSLVKRVCWIPVSRLSSDTVTITHHTDIDGVSEVSLSMIGFYDRRVEKSGQ